ncbi:MAG TPA: hypothetical protein VLJ38_07330 [Polyangiaceae bacterium]|nr:hypothetical protein [Polyangiaceae bacterium]
MSSPAAAKLACAARMIAIAVPRRFGYSSRPRAGMRGCTLFSAIVGVCVVVFWAQTAAASSPTSTAAYTPGTDVVTQPAPAPAASAEPLGPQGDVLAPEQHGTLTVERVAQWRGFLFYPSMPTAGTFRFALGASYDAVDPAVVYGMTFRFPQLTLDAIGWLGNGWSLKGHINSMIVLNEFLFGAGYTFGSGPLSLEIDASVGVYVGSVGAVIGGTSGVGGFNALFVAPEYRPELTLGYDFGKLAVSLRGSLLLMGPERARVGDTWGGFDNAHPFAGHSEMLYVENTTKRSSVWYFGAGAMTTRAYYALWILFPDSPALYTYPRMVVGYEY